MTAGNYIKYEQEIELETYSPCEKACGYLQDVRKELNSNQSHNFSGFITVKEYSKKIAKA
ncbi:MAG: hypothetical protein SPL76_05680 [Cyanobacteriota bacterium]|nr:hypothetical protein [Cyanobacteriota bacterium]